MFVDPSGAKNEANDPDKNPASFSSAADLLNYIMEHGIGGFGYEYMSWSFAASGGGGGMDLASFQYSNDISYTSGGISIRWSGSINDGVNAGFGNMSTLNTFVLGTKFISAQHLWSGALQYGENHRNVSYGWFGGNQGRDVMWDHNYDVYRQRLNAGRPLQQPGDRASYKEQFGSLGGYYRGDQQGKMFYGGMVAVMAAPFLIEFTPLAVEGYTAANATITDLSYEAYHIAFTGLNNLRYAIGAGTAMYFQQTNLPVYNSLMSFANGLSMLPSGGTIAEWYNAYQDIKDIREHYTP